MFHFVNHQDVEKVYYKVLSEDMNRNGFQYVIGHNVLKETFDRTEKCGPGGLYFCDFYEVFRWISWMKTTNKQPAIICKVKLVPGAQIVEMPLKCKTDQMILYDPVSIEEFIKNNVDKLTEDIAREYPEGFQFIKSPSHKVCFRAVTINPQTFKYIDIDDFKELYSILSSTIAAINRTIRRERYIFGKCNGRNDSNSLDIRKIDDNSENLYKKYLKTKRYISHFDRRNDIIFCYQIKCQNVINNNQHLTDDEIKSMMRQIADNVYMINQRLQDHDDYEKKIYSLNNKNDNRDIYCHNNNDSSDDNIGKNETTSVIQTNKLVIYV